MKGFIALLVLAIAATLAVGANVNDPSITGYCDLTFHKYSGCVFRNGNKDYGINQKPILCFNDIQGYTERSRICVESIMCGDRNCDSKDGDESDCVQDMLDECGSLRRTYTGPVRSTFAEN